MVATRRPISTKAKNLMAVIGSCSELEVFRIETEPTSRKFFILNGSMELISIECSFRPCASFHGMREGKREEMGVGAARGQRDGDMQRPWGGNRKTKNNSESH